MRFGSDLRDGFALFGCVLGFEGAAGVVEAAELDGDAGTNAYQGGECAFVEGSGAFIAEYLSCAVQGAFVVGRCLESDFDDIYAMLEGRSVIVQASGECTEWLTCNRMLAGVFMIFIIFSTCETRRKGGNKYQSQTQRQLRTRPSKDSLNYEPLGNDIPISTCATPPTAPAKRSFKVLVKPAFASSNASAILAVFSLI